MPKVPREYRVNIWNHHGEWEYIVEAIDALAAEFQARASARQDGLPKGSLVTVAVSPF